MNGGLVTRIATVVASLAVAAAVVGPSGASTEVDPPLVKPVAARPSIKYVALGSSYAAGPDTGGVDNVRCVRASDNYPHRVAAALGYMLTDVSCSGATTANILSVPQRPFAAYPQIDAVTPDTRLVTVTIGGNDLGYVGRLVADGCGNVASFSPRAISMRCLDGRVPTAEPGPARYAALTRALVHVANAVRDRAPRATVVFVDYPPVIGANGATCPLALLTPEQAAETVRVFNGLTVATARAAHTTGSILVTASKAGAAHTVCSPMPWLYGFAPPAPYHPNELGKAGVAQLILTALPPL